MGADLLLMTWTRQRNTADNEAVLAEIINYLDTSSVSNVLDFCAFTEGRLDGTGIDLETIATDNNIALSTPFNEVTLADADALAEIKSEIHGFVKDGIAEYFAAGEGRSCGLFQQIGGTSLTVVSVGGTSWGDDPFDGFTDLAMFLNACEKFPAVAKAAGFVCFGSPDLETVIANAEGLEGMLIRSSITTRNA